MEKTWYVILGSFTILSLVVLTFSNHPIHEEIHIASAFSAIILGMLSFKGYFKYRLIRLIFSGLAFITFGIVEGIQVYIVEEDMNKPGSLQEIEEYLIVLGLGLFGLGTMFKVRSKKS